MSPVALPMSEPKKPYCRYTNVKIDADCLYIARAAAALAGKKMQDWLSDLINEEGSKEINRKPIKRKDPPPPKKRGPKKSDP